MPNVLEVQIVGDISNLEKSLKKAESLQAEYTASVEKTSNELKENIAVTNGYKKAIDDLNSAYKNGSVSSKEYSKQLANLKRDEKESTVVTSELRKELANLKREQKDLGGATGTLSKRTADGSNALMQFSRIAQDAPYGIQGIGNNITATVEAFGYLKKSTGSTGAALKAVAGSILGSGGILLAISLVTAGLTYMAQNGLSVGDVFNKLTGNFDEARASMQELSTETVKGSAEQITSMNALVAVAKNVNLADKDRLIAVQKLQSEYPAYFGNLTQEQILNGNVASAVEGVTKALIAKAKATASVAKIVKLAEEEEKIQQDISNQLNDVAKGYQLNKKEAEDFNKAVLAGGDAFKLLDPYKKRAGFFDVAEAVTLNSTLDSLNNKLATNKGQQDKLTKSVNETTAAYIQLESAAPKAEKAINAPKAPKEPKRPKLKFDQGFITGGVIAPLIGDSLNLESALLDLNLEIPEVKTDAYLESLRRAKQAADIFSTGTSAAIGSLGSSIAAKLQTGNAALDAFTSSVLGSLADIAAAQLSSFIAQQVLAKKEIVTSAGVSTAKAIESGTKTAAASGPAAAFVLPALVGAAVGFIAASFAGIKFAHGGVVPGGSFTGDKVPAMLNSGEAVMNQQQQANTLMAIANGNSNSLQGNVAGGSFSFESKLRGSDLLLILKREEKKR